MSAAGARCPRLLAVAVIGGADAAALWALSSGNPKAHLLEDPPPQRVEITVPDGR